MNKAERQALGWCLERGNVPACVAGVPTEAWSGPVALLLEVLVAWQAEGLSWAPTDLWAWVRGDARLSRLLWADEVLVAPLAAPWDLEGVEEACEVVARAHQETAWWVALAHEIEEARYQARIDWVVRMAA